MKTMNIQISINKIMSTLSDFEILSKIGEGLYSIVHKVRRDKDNMVYALKQVKLIDMPANEIQNAINQVRILASIRHPNVIGYKQAFYDQFTKTLCIVMEYADGGDLEQKITQHKNKGQYFKQDQIWDLFGQMLVSLAKLHDLGVLHRDVKSANFYLTRNGTIKLGDMNVSKVIRKTGMCQTQTGAPYYASPQVWRNQAYDVKSDIWSLGCVLYELINLKLPFKARDMEGLMKKVTRGYYSRINKSYSDDLSLVLKFLLQTNPKQRKYCSQLLQIPLIKRNIRKQKDIDLEQKSILLKTIRLNKNLGTLGNNLPKPNYSPLKFKSQSLSQSVGRSHSQLQYSKSTNKAQKLDLSLKLSLPPLSGPIAHNIQKKTMKIFRYQNQPESPMNRRTSEDKNRPKYKKARSYMMK